MKNSNICTASGCKCQFNYKVQRNWGVVDIVGFCDEHAPQWLKNLKINQNSEVKTILGFTGSPYKRVSL